jgi:8-oxo-dGTP pyrophosphatase MutT (NUDIX family)
MAKREFSAGGIVIKGAAEAPKVLLIKDSYGRWTWPKGKIAPGESSSAAGLREVKEETGLKDIQLLEKIGQNQYFFRQNNELIFKTVTIFLYETNSEEKLAFQKEEVQDARWFSPQEALENLAYKKSEEILKKAIKRYQQLKEGK